jgi:NAD-dependent SIR2 family protein deacetylase
MDTLKRAAQAIEQASVLHVCTGAGMGVDSGLPDFRGPQGFWKAYPAYKHLGLRFHELADPRWFAEDPALAWGFYGHRLGLYRSTVPHTGYDILRRWSESRTTTVFTSNVDGQHAAAGMVGEALFEVHGNIHHMQCSEPCCTEVWSGEGVAVDVDPTSFRARGTLPKCPYCGALVRPNILMFGDWGFLSTRSDRQARAYQAVHGAAEGQAVVVEIGAGTAVPSVRMHSEELQRRGATLVRINPREPQGPRGTLGLALGGAEALAALQACLA